MAAAAVVVVASYFDDSRQKYFAATLEPAEFDVGSFMFTLSYHPGVYLEYDMQNTGGIPLPYRVPLWCVRSTFLFHSLISPNDTPNPLQDGTLPYYMPPPASLTVVNRLMRRFGAGAIISKKGPVEQLRKQIRKHAVNLGLTKEQYTQSSVNLCNRLVVDGILQFLFDEGCRRFLVKRTGLPRNWWAIRLGSMCEILHDYRYLNGRKLSFRFLEGPNYAFIKEILISLRLVDDPAMRLKPVFVLAPNSPPMPTNRLIYFMNVNDLN